MRLGRPNAIPPNNDNDGEARNHRERIITDKMKIKTRMKNLHVETMPIVGLPIQ